MRVLRELETRTLETKMVVVYLFYDADNPIVVRNVAKEFVYE